MPSLDHRVLVWVLGAATAAVSAAASAEDVPRYRVQDLGGLMAAAGLNLFDSHLEDINNAGTVVGGGWGASPLFVIKQGRLSLLSVGNGVSEGRATAVNERGDVLAWTLSNSGYRDVVYRDGMTRNITAPQGTALGPVKAMNEAGRVIGQVIQTDGHGGSIGEWLPIINDAAGSRFISVPGARSADAVTLKDHGTVIGMADLFSRGNRVFVWRDGHSDILPVPSGSGDSPDDYYFGLDVNNAGQMLVHHMVIGPAGPGMADFIFQGGHYTRLPLDADQRFEGGVAVDINERGWVVGAREFEQPDGARPDQRAFLYRDGQVHDLDSLLRPQDAQRWQLFEASALNDRGQIIGTGYLNGQWRHYLATPVPEAGTWALWLAGLNVIGWRWRSRQVLRLPRGAETAKPADTGKDCFMSSCPGPMGLAAAAVLAFAHAGAQAELRYRLQPLTIAPDVGDFGEFRPEAVNNRGEVVGTALNFDKPMTAFVYRGGSLRPLVGGNAYYSSQAFDINDRGQIAGALQPSVERGQWRPFIHANGRFDDLGIQADIDSGYTSSLNAAGQAVGRAGSKIFVYDGAHTRYLDIPGSTYSSRSFINDHGVVAGNVVVNVPGGTDWRAFVHDGRELQFLPRAIPNSHSLGVADINNAGQIAEYVLSDQGQMSSFIYADGRFTDLGGLGGPVRDTVVRALNEKGWAVGDAATFCDVHSCSDGFLYREGRMFNLNDLVRPQDALGWRITHPRDINDRGQIVGNGYFQGQYRAFLATPVPEPGSGALLLAGLGMVSAVSWRRARRWPEE